MGASRPSSVLSLMGGEERATPLLSPFGRFRGCTQMKSVRNGFAALLFLRRAQ